MRRRIPVVIGLIWLLVASALYGFFTWNGQPDGIYTSENDGCVLDQLVYVADQQSEEGLIYEMDLYGAVQNFFSTKELCENASICKVAAYEDKIYAVMAIPNSLGLSDVYTYRILCFSEGLTLESMTPELSLYEMDQLTDLVVDESGIYLATVTRDGDAASVYEIESDQLMDSEEAEALSTTVESFLRQEAEAGRTYIEASYELGAISVRTDADRATGPFAVDDTVRYTYSICSMDFGQLMHLHSEYKTYWLVAVLAGWIVIFLLYVLFRNHNRIVYLAIVLELTLLVVILGGSGLLTYLQKQTEENSKEKWISVVLKDAMADAADSFDTLPTNSDFYTSESYVQLQDYLQTVYTQTEDDGCIDAFLADTSEQCIYVSVSGRNQETVASRYFPSEDRKKQLAVSGAVTATAFTLDETNHQIFTVSMDDTAAEGYMLCAVYQTDEWGIEDLQQQIMGTLLVFAIASLICLMILAMQSTDLIKLSHAMQQVAGGRTDIRRPEVISSDMRVLWNALAEIQNQIRKVNYSKFLAFEAYYRFAPKNIERLLEKESITEVTSGDVKKLNGTMALISTVGTKSGSKEELSRLTRLLALIGTYQEEQDGVLVSNDAALSMLRFLSMEQNQHTLANAMDFLHELAGPEREDRRQALSTTILLHYSSFVYGVAGTKQQSATFLVSPETDEIERFASWFRERGLRLVISETVKERENYKGALRCVGYIQMSDSNKKMKMYEVLDVYDVRERERKIAVLDRFAQALELFYQHDFYLARSTFSDILKELPTDEITKWYLFTCETYLNMDHPQEFSCALCYE